ncbi:MAG: phenylphosphate carboxylase subunit delta [Deltaproteobacteria bacterium]|nr:MAG: phenylphosphate carboxylase subunit delta [Deltaproteobacteria bacterium]
MEKKAAKIKLLFLDVDGVLTDGRIIMNAHGEEIKAFDVKDGQGLKMLLSIGVEVAIVSGRKSRVVEYRARDLGIKQLYQGVNDKKSLCRQLIEERGLEKEQVCCMGDDLPDLAMFRESGLRIAVADAAEEVRRAADRVTKNRGGRGAVREVCEWLLACRGK